MAKQLQLRRGTTAQHSAFTGALGEVTVDTDKKILVVHDGSTAGGIPLAKQATVDTKVDKITSTDNAIARYDGTDGAIQNSSVIIDDSGNVGIGTSSPSVKLHLQSNSATYIQITDGGDGASRIGQNGTALTFGVDLADGSTERMRIDSSGNLLVGTTTDNGVDKLQVNGNISAISSTVIRSPYISDANEIKNASGQFLGGTFSCNGSANTPYTYGIIQQFAYSESTTDNVAQMFISIIQNRMWTRIKNGEWTSWIEK